MTSWHDVQESPALHHKCVCCGHRFTSDALHTHVTALDLLFVAVARHPPLRPRRHPRPHPRRHPAMASVLGRLIAATLHAGMRHAPQFAIQE